MALNRRIAYVLEAIVVVLFVVLVWQNYQMRRLLDRTAHHGSGSHGFDVRDAIPPFSAVTLDNKPITLDHRTRTTVAIVSPDCPSCESLLQALPRDAAVRVLSIGAVPETKAMAERYGVQSRTYVVGSTLPKTLDQSLRTYPQLFVAERGMVVRKCAAVQECVPH